MSTEQHFDIAVIGGGINGCGIARDAAGRGAKVVLFERGDLAQGTSSASTKLIHGGLRYLEHYEFGLVRESLREREKLWAISPHLIQPRRFILPYIKGLRPRWLLRLGLFIYDHIGGRRILPATQSLDLTKHIAGEPLKPEFRRGYAYSDACVDDARLVIMNARDAADRGAVIETQTEVVDLRRDKNFWHITLADGRIFCASIVVNAAGPSVLALLDHAKIQHDHNIRLVRGSHIVVRQLFIHDYAYFFQLPDGRIFFAIPYEHKFTLIGTTDQDHGSASVPIEISDAEIAYLCDGMNQYFQKQIGPADICWSYSGVRPLVDDGSGKPESATRGYRFEIDGDDQTPIILSIFGGKITTYRHVSTEAVDLLSRYCLVLQGEDWTSKHPLPGGDFPMTELDTLIENYAKDYPYMERAWVDRIARGHGTRARLWLGDAQSLDALGPHFGHGLTGAEVEYMIDQEWALSAEDILWRRTKLGLHFDAAQTSALAVFIKTRLTQK